MVCPCCVSAQCGIKELADSVNVTFSSTFRPWWEGSDPCYSPVSVYFCPHPLQNTLAFQYAAGDPAVYGRPADDEPYSGPCNRYNGTHVIDFSNDVAQPSYLSHNWCTTAGTQACPASFLNRWHQFNSSGYEASCSRIRAWHSMIGYEFTRWFIALIDSVAEGGTFIRPDTSRMQYRLIEGPTKLGTSAGRDWFKVRYSYLERGPGNFDSYNDSNGTDTFAHCLAECPTLELG